MLSSKKMEEYSTMAKCLGAVVFGICSTPISTVVGSAVMQRVGFSGYDTSTSAQIGAVGAAVLCPLFAAPIVSADADDSDFPVIRWLSGVAILSGLYAVNGAVGSLVLAAAGHLVQPVKESVIAGVVGFLVVLAAGCAPCVMIYSLVKFAVNIIELLD